MHVNASRATYILVIFFCLVIDSARADPTPPAQMQAVADAESVGRALFDAASSSVPADDALIASARSKVTDFCSFSYRSVVLKAGDTTLVYFLAEPAKNGDIVFGRHYRISGGVVTPSTKSCFVQPVSPNAEAAFITHILSDAPTEFHVYESLAQPLPIYVGTKVGMWFIERGKITYKGPLHDSQ